MPESNFPQKEDKLSTGLKILSFLIPIAGAVIYFANKSNSPNKAQSACTAALWGVGLSIALNVLVALLTMAS